MPLGLIAEINASKKIRQEIYEILKVQSLDENHHVSQFNLASPNLYCISHITSCTSISLFTVHFHVSCTVHFTMYLQTVISLFSFFVIDRTRKQTLFIKQFNFVFIKDLPSVSLSNDRAITAENE